MAEQVAPDKLPRWADDGGVATEPSEGKKDTGWISLERPPADYFNWILLKSYQWLNYFKLRLAATIGWAADTTLTLASDSVTPTQGNHTIDTQSAAASDDLKNIVTTNLDEGRLLIIRAANGARDVVVKHAATGAGQIFLYNAVDFTLDDTSKTLTLKRVGADWYEVCRSFFNPLSGLKTTVYTASGTHTLTKTGYKAWMKGGASGGASGNSSAGGAGNNGAAGSDSWVGGSGNSARGGNPGLAAAGSAPAALTPALTSTLVRFGAMAGGVRSGDTGGTNPNINGKFQQIGAAGGIPITGVGGTGQANTGQAGGGAGGHDSLGGGSSGQHGEEAEYYGTGSVGDAVTVTVGNGGAGGASNGFGLGAGGPGGKGCVIIEE